MRSKRRKGKVKRGGRREEGKQRRKGEKEGERERVCTFTNQYKLPSYIQT